MKPEPASSGDVLSSLVAAVRLSGSLQFCFMPAGNWQTDDAPAMAALAGSGPAPMPFHVVTSGSCWLKVDTATHELAQGDVLLFPFGTGHQLGRGCDGALVAPTRSLPPGPWREVPVLRHGDGPPDVRLLCGFIRCDALRFRPLARHLPNLVLIRTADDPELGFLRAVIGQMAAEVDRPRPGAVSVLERLTEIVFLETVRHVITTAPAEAGGLLAALRDRRIARALELLHHDPHRAWSLAGLASASAMSRSGLAQLFKTALGLSPMQYLREWRLYLASVELACTDTGIAELAARSGYGSEAAFCRAFARCYHLPPGAYRSAHRQAV
ncbi:AraC family transcriptional regulator [Pseudooceanicola lipolyticus]|uniref:AraC family transcriptional regulator n=1 Tax=Pseudooceanicola lipolyticus TaxID=2029104 RepID=A0A2M8IXD0_9RHOB|nr:AraC family transcriptional regulator [Pseudooceanicola lipolyticus]PJE35172.1 AraC family transcriptional regulator [Pseudooceanicola lipolyticus]